MDQVSINYGNIFYCKTLQNLPKFGFFGLKTNHLANLSCTWDRCYDFFDMFSLKQCRFDSKH
jgi:hypothetical protein